VNKNKVLILDVETSPMLAYIWELKDQFVGLNQVAKDWYIMAWSAKWLGEPDSSIVYHDLRAQKAGNDLPILKPLWKLLDEADIIITQNGKAFDSKKINARFMLNGMKPPKPYAHIDTYLLVKKVAAFTSSSLEYLTSKFCTKHKKTSHGKFPGMRLWIECIKGNKAAWDEMKKYNVEDVLSTEELYLKIRAWAPEAIPKVFHYTDASKECGRCGYKGPMREGKERLAKTYKYKQHSCPRCGAWQKGERVK
jgi:hypothetical protein